MLRRKVKQGKEIGSIRKGCNFRLGAVSRKRWYLQRSAGVEPGAVHPPAFGQGYHLSPRAFACLHVSHLVQNRVMKSLTHSSDIVSPPPHQDSIINSFLLRYWQLLMENLWVVGAKF